MRRRSVPLIENLVVKASKLNEVYAFVVVDVDVVIGVDDYDGVVCVVVDVDGAIGVNDDDGVVFVVVDFDVAMV